MIFQYFMLLTLLLLALGCQRLDNAAEESLLTCGIEMGAEDRLLKIEGVSELDAVLVAQDGVQHKIQTTARNCLRMPHDLDGTLYIRDKDQQGQGLSLRTENLGRGLSFHSLSFSDRLVQKTQRLQCPENAAVQDQVVFKTMSADPLRAHLPSARLTLFNERGELISKTIVILSETMLSLPLPIEEGRYRLSLENFDGFAPDVVEPGLSCELTVDRSAPQLVAPREKFKEVSPGQVLEFPAHDTTRSQLYLCAKKREKEEHAGADCLESEFLPAASYVVPVEGVWDLHYYAEDQAGNKSPIQLQTIAIFHRDTIEQIKLLSREFQRLLATTTQQYKAFKTYQRLVKLAQKLTLKAEIKEVYWKLLGNFASVSQMTLVSRDKMPNGPGRRPPAAEREAVSPHADYPYRATIVRNGLQHDLKIFDTRYPDRKALGMSISADASENSLGAILRFHPKVPYLLYVAAGRFLLEFDLRSIVVNHSGDSPQMTFETGKPYSRQIAAETVVTEFTPSEDGRLVAVNTSGGWIENHAFPLAQYSLWPHAKSCGQGDCRYYLERRTSVSFDRKTRVLVWQSDRDELERRLESPVDLYDWLEIDPDTLLLLGKDKGLYLWKPRTGTMTQAGSTAMPPYNAHVLTAFDAVIISDRGENSAVLRKTSQGWELLDQVFRGEVVRVAGTSLPVFKYKDDEQGVGFAIYDRNFKLLKSTFVIVGTPDDVLVRDHYLYYPSQRGVERLDIMTQEFLPPMSLPAGYEAAVVAGRLVLKRWNSDKNALEFWEWMPADGSLQPLDAKAMDPANKEGTIVDADGDRFFLPPTEYFFFDEFHGMHLDRGEDFEFHKDMFIVDPHWFDQQLKKRLIYSDPD